VLVAADPAPNASLRAIAGAIDATAGTLAVPFSSRRRWSAATGTNGTAWFLGAPDAFADLSASARTACAAHTSQGRRVLLVARGDRPSGEQLPSDVEPIALVVLAEELRADARETVQWFGEQGVAIKVLSGDDPATVGHIAAAAGIDGADAPVDARDLPEPGPALAAALEEVSVIGRVDPHRKREIVRALQGAGHVVAMTGDGVNDVLALKDADLGVAMGSGSPAARAVARLVLLDSSWSALPAVVAEGRRVAANIERVANLFVTKTVYATLLAVAVGVAQLPFPFLPRQLTIVSSLTIGIPAFFLALAPNPSRAQPHFARRVVAFALPAGTVAAGATFAGYALARGEPGVSLLEARTAATVVLFAVATWVLSILARPWTVWRGALVAASVSSFLVLAAIPRVRTVFALDLPSLVVVLAVIGVAAIASGLLEAGWRVSGWVSTHAGASVNGRRRLRPRRAGPG
jgi:cation-transporting ATPase E